MEASNKRCFFSENPPRADVGSKSNNKQHKQKARTVFSKEKIAQEMKKITDLWSQQRFENAFEQLLQQYNPTFKLTAKVKVEPMPAGKPPRLLIADSDSGQIMALLTIHMMEMMIFNKYKSRSIKKRARKAALHDVVEYLNGSKKNCDKGSVI